MEGNDTSEEELLITMEKMAMIEKHFPPEQLEALKKRREALGPEALQAALIQAFSGRDSQIEASVAGMYQGVRPSPFVAS